MSRRRIIDHEWQHDREPVDAVVLGCVDRRFKGWRKLFGEYEKFTMSFPLTIPGGVKDLVDPKHPRDTEHLLEKIKLLIHYYPDLKLVIMAHDECLDCDQIREPAYYEELLLLGGRLLHKRFPHQQIFPVFLHFEGIDLVEEEAVREEVLTVSL